MSQPANLAEDLTLSMLAVNNYPLTSALGLRDNLHQEGFFDPSSVASWRSETRIAKLQAAGYNRGGYLPFLSDRLQKLAEFLNSDQAGALARELATGSEENVERMLKGIYGVGPAVMENFWILQNQK